MWRARSSVVGHRHLRRRALARRALWTGAEIAVTLGAVLLLLVAHQLWWTNREARADADRTVRALEREWRDPDTPDTADTTGTTDSTDITDATDTPDPSPDTSSGTSDTPAPRNNTRSQTPPPTWNHAYAVLTIPRLGLRVPVAQGVGKAGVLNKGYVGHYPGTAQPGQAGNFALAGHRNTHGEPFRYINRLRKGDEIGVETKSATYTYVVDRTLPQTSAGDGGVIRPVPRSQVRTGYGYSEPGYYLTLTTCTPEYTSRYRLIVWGKLTSMRPR
ncbi:class E sortase [Streptomyces sp. NPDC058001]|uniref:class E sortase n=1 Tax=Streptomyces sp. NPDC058001 TaxID=3346300 RepID=UPI0036E21F7D